MASNRLTVTLNLERWPEALSAIRKEVCRALEDEAESASDPRVASALREVALRFEVGLTQKDGSDE